MSFVDRQMKAQTLRYGKNRKMQISFSIFSLNCLKGNARSTYLYFYESICIHGWTLCPKTCRRTKNTFHNQPPFIQSTSTETYLKMLLCAFDYGDIDYESVLTIINNEIFSKHTVQAQYQTLQKLRWMATPQSRFISIVHIHTRIKRHIIG